MESREISRNKKSNLVRYGVIAGTVLLPLSSFAAVDTTAIDGALTDIQSVATAMITLAVGAMAAWALYRKLKG